MRNNKTFRLLPTETQHFPRQMSIPVGAVVHPPLVLHRAGSFINPNQLIPERVSQVHKLHPDRAVALR